MADKSRGDKFPLLIYRRWAGKLRLPGLLLAIGGGVLWWAAPLSPMLAGKDWAVLAIGGVGIAIFIYSLWAQHTAYVQCLPRFVKIRLPLFSVAISYQRILQVRPVEFRTELPWSEMRSAQRRLVEPFLGHTAVLLELSGYPIDRRRLRFWVPRFMLASRVTGFVLVIEDWMGLSRQVTIFSDRWVARRRARQKPSAGRLF